MKPTAGIFETILHPVEAFNHIRASREPSFRKRSFLMLMRASRERRVPRSETREVCVNTALYSNESIHDVFIIMSTAACMNSNS